VLRPIEFEYQVLRHCVPPLPPLFLPCRLPQAVTCGLDKLPFGPDDVRWQQTSGWQPGCDGDTPGTPGQQCVAQCALPDYDGPGYSSTCQPDGTWSELAGECHQLIAPGAPMEVHRCAVERVCDAVSIL
jgi:hypothetical protein